MTFKRTSELLNHLDRVASASTREHANGRIDMVPPWAKEPEDYYNSVRDQYDSLRNQFVKVQRDLSIVNEKLKRTLIHAEFHKVNIEKERLSALHTKIQNELVGFKELLRALASKSWANAFVAIAKAQLDSKTFGDLCTQTNDFMKRAEFDGIKVLNEYQKDKYDKAKKIKTKLKNFRHFQKGDNRSMVWSDENGGYVPILKQKTI